MTGKITGALREQSDWEQQDENRLGFIQNKPFYDARKTEECRIRPRFESEPLQIDVPSLRDKYIPHTDGTVYLFKISDIVPTIEEVNDATLVTDNGEEFPINIAGSFVLEETEAFTFYVLHRSAAITDDFVVIAEAQEQDSYKGIYLASKFENNEGKIYNGDIVITRTIGELKTLEPKYLPNESKPKILDLDTYQTSTGTSIGATLLGLVMQGGGKASVSGEDVEKFWEDAITDNVVITKFHNLNYDIYTPCVVTKVTGGKIVVQLSSYTSIYNQTAFLKVNIAFTATTADGMVVHVQVDA